MATKKVKRTGTKERVLLREPKMPTTTATAPINIDQDDVSVLPVMNELRAAIRPIGKINYSCHPCGCGDPDCVQEEDWDDFKLYPEDLNKIAKLLEEYKEKLPGIDGTKDLYLNIDWNEWDISYRAKRYRSLEEIVKLNKAYQKRLDEYNKKMEIYNSPASRKAREEAAAKKERLKMVAAKKRELQKELRKLRV